MDNTEFRRVAHRFVEWIADYYDNIESYPVSAQIKPGEIFNQIKISPPESGESIEDIFLDFEKTIMPGITHWQHPHFYGTHPGQTTYPSLLAEMLTVAMSQERSHWQHSPAAVELELRVTDWLRQLLGLPTTFTGSIQDNSSISTLIAILTAREKWSAYHVGQKGLYRHPRFIVYASKESEASLLKAMRISGLGEQNLRYIDVNEKHEMNKEALLEAIEKDKKKKNIPLLVIATFGTENIAAMDPLHDICRIAKKNRLWVHVDAAYAGAAMTLPECRHFSDCMNDIDSLVIDPHKWLLTSAECSVYFVKDVKALNRTMGLLSCYVEDKKKNKKSDDAIKLTINEGRRFRALKLWFVLREYGADGIQRFIRNHINLAQSLAEKIEASEGFELLVPVNFNIICFRYNPNRSMKKIAIDAFNYQLLERLNASGKIYLTPIELEKRYGLRLVIGQTWVTAESVNLAWQRIVKTAEQLSGEM